MCDECCQTCQDRANELGVHPGSVGPDKLDDTQPVTLYTGTPKFGGLPFDQRKANYVQRQADAAGYFNFG